MVTTSEKKFPLLEAIFELRWGENAPGQFQYSQDEQTLFAGQISSAASAAGFSVIEFLQNRSEPPLPMRVTHRFRREAGTWPCFQVGLGVFTVNQLDDGYSWRTFLDSIRIGLDVFTRADPSKLEESKDSLTVILRYQDAFYPPEGRGTEQYLSDHFRVNVNFPDEFFEGEIVDRSSSSLSLTYTSEVHDPIGRIIVSLNSAVINGKPGLLMETVVESKVSIDLEGKIEVDQVLDWAERSHKLQQHSFKTLIEKTAYR